MALCSGKLHCYDVRKPPNLLRALDPMKSPARNVALCLRATFVTISLLASLWRGIP